jgi:hypothetical protein
LSGLLENINVRAAKAVNRLFAIADNEKIRVRRRRAECQCVHQLTLHAVRILKFINQKETIALGCPGENRGLF